MITLIFFGMLYRFQYAVDTYQVFVFSEQGLFLQFAKSGRFITAIISRIVSSLNLSEQTIYCLSYILAISCMILSQYKIYKIIEKDVKSKILKILIPVLIIINPFSIELFLFIEKSIMIFAILMCICAIEYLIKYFEDKQKKNIIFSMIFMFIANCSYQGVVGIFIAIGIVYILKYSKTIKQFILNNFITAMIYGVPAILDYCIVKILYPTSRINGEIIFVESLNKILVNTFNMIKTTYGILPKYMFLAINIFTFIMLCYKIIKENQYKYTKKEIYKSIKVGLLEILKYFYIIIGTIVISVIPQFLQPTNSIWLVPRSTYPFGAIYGILVLYLCLNYKIGKKALIVLVTLSLVLLMVQLQTFLVIENDRYILNKNDYYETMQIIDMVKKYELYTGRVIEKIEIYEDSSPKYTYDGIFATGDINIKAYSNDWSTEAILEYYLGRDLQKLNNNQELKEKFLKEDWNEFDEEQIIFKEDVLILCRY